MRHHWWVLKGIALVLVVFQNCSDIGNSTKERLSDGEAKSIAGQIESLNSFAQTGRVFKHSDVLFSPRFGGRTERLDIGDRFFANTIAWHYPNIAGAHNYTLIDEARRRGYTHFQCALPAITRSEASACRTFAGTPMQHASVAGTTAKVYYPDITTQAFRNEILDFLDQAAANGCTSLQQDDYLMNIPHFLQGCRGGIGERDMPPRVKRHYQWIKQEVRARFGHDIPISLNLHLQYSEPLVNDAHQNTVVKPISAEFNGAVNEVYSRENNPYFLYKGFADHRARYGLRSTATTLVSRSVANNQYHIATAYAFGANPIVPFDVYIGPNQDRFTGRVEDFAHLFKLVRDNEKLFDGYEISDVLIDHNQVTQNTDRDPRALVYSENGFLEEVSGQSSYAIALRKKANSAVIHIASWSQDTRDFSIVIRKSSVSSNINAGVIHHAGGETTEVELISKDSNSWQLNVSGVKVWSLIELKEVELPPPPTETRLTQVPQAGDRTTDIKVISANAGELSHYIYKIGPDATTTCLIGQGYSKPVGINKNIRYTVPGPGKYKVCVRGRRAGPYAPDSYESLASVSVAKWEVANTPEVPVDTRLVDPPMDGQRDIDVRVISANSGELSHYIYKVGPKSSTPCSTGGYSQPQGINRRIKINISGSGEYKLCVRGRRAGPYTPTSYEPANSPANRPSSVVWKL